MSFVNMVAKEQPSVKIWVPDKAIAPKAHDVLQKAATNRLTQDELQRIARDFDLNSLDVVVKVTEEPEDGVEDNKIVFLYRQENPTGFNQRDLMTRARLLLGSEVSITWDAVSPNTPAQRMQQAEAYAAAAHSECVYNSERDRGRGGIAGEVA